MFQKSILTNGLRLITEELPYFHSAALGVWLEVGSRDEAPEENGLTHFLEHLAFKGTSKRTALGIAREIDQLGGSCNAFTSKEQTCFHGKVLAEQLPRLVDLLGDLVLNPLYRPEELEKERQVILEEISAQEDSPEDQVQVLFARRLWGDNPFGRPILGKAEQISRISREDLLAYRGATYRPEQTVVAAAGRLQHQELVEAAEVFFRDFENGSRPRRREAVTTFSGVHTFTRDLEQVHLCLGTRGPAAGDGKRYAATLLQLILGGNMSSRLFQVVREQLGLAYSIYAFLSFFSDTGLLGISAGVSPKNLEPVIAAICRELKRLKDEAVLEAELQAAQDYVKVSIYLAAEDCEHRMVRLAKNEIHFGRYITLEEIIAGMMAVTVQEIQELARELCRPENWALALLGPV
ncbi:MAG: pitrilysin family protein, partial [Desulfobaccales bacterium]|nr:pitrilysin family protein [Desulfobaccales bacterium]